MPAHIISSEQQRDRMLHTPIPKLIVSLSIPTLASQLISVFYNTADTYFVSKLSTSASAAVGVVFSLMSIIQAFGFGIGMGCGSIISRSLGSRDNERADRTVFFCTISCFSYRVVIWGICSIVCYAVFCISGRYPFTGTYQSRCPEHQGTCYCHKQPEIFSRHFFHLMRLPFSLQLLLHDQPVQKL